jgi:putative membrane protein
VSISDLPALNASLNGLSAILLVAGYLFIRNKRIAYHRLCMGAAFTTSILFLVSYLYYHYHHGATRYPGVGAIRVLYFSILITHTILAAFVPILATITLYRALRSRFDRHRKIARWTLPIWLYVSITGVIIYAMLYV